MRASNKELGPKRLARSSYGILRTEPFKQWKEHDGLNPYYNPYDSQPYIKDTVDWILKLVRAENSIGLYSPMRC